MNSIKSYFAIIAIMAFFISSAVAQPHSGKRGQNQKPSIEQLKADLQLSDDQSTQLEAIKQQFSSDIKALKADESTTNESKKEAFTRLYEQHKTAIENILTQEQLLKMKTMKEERRAMQKERKEDIRSYRKSIDKEGMKEELKSYKQENIRPVMIEQRQKLEREISKKDKVEIDELREKAIAFKAEMKASRQEFKANHKPGQKPDNDRKEKMQNLIQPHKANLEKAKAIAEKYDPEITGLLEEIAPEKETWKEEIKSIRDKYLPAEKPEGVEKFGKKPHKRFHGEKGLVEGRPFTDRDQRQKVRFLLLDPNKKEVASDPVTAPTTIKNLRVYPNPALSSNKLEYEVTAAGKVLVELQNSQGQVVRTLVNMYQETGVYTVEVDLSNVKGNVFYYVIKNQNSVLSQKVIKAPGH